MAHWLDDEYWACTAHLRTARIAAIQPTCWYGCGTVRPERSSVVAPIAKVAPKALTTVTFVAGHLAPGTDPDQDPIRVPVDSIRPRTFTDPPKKVPAFVKMSFPVPTKAPPTMTPKVPPPSAPERTGQSGGPTAKEIRRGATYKVGCLECQAALWRRKKDVEGGQRPFCSPQHRAAFEARSKV